MTIPSRPAPPPPQRNTNTPLRYTPTTDWDFCAFDSVAPSSSSSSTASNPAANFQQQPQYHQPNAKSKKPPPPRPPPPKLTAAPTAPLKKPGQPQSINILSNLFGHKRASTGSAGSANKSNGAGIAHQKSGAVKLLPPPPPTGTSKGLGKTAATANHPRSFDSGSSSHYGSLYGSIASNSTPASVASGANADMQLISFDSPPSSPTFTQKSCSDCISVDSFSSDSNYSSPNNGNMSQAESGFEDDFVACANNNRGQRPGSGVPWGGDPLDPFDAGSISGRSGAAPSPVIYGTIPMAPSSSSSAQIRAPLLNSKLQQSDFIDPLCNGQSALPKVPIMAMPTIIKPPSGSGSDSQKSTPSHSMAALRSNSGAVGIAMAPKKMTHSHYDGPVDSESFDSLTSRPMPSMPPPPPPPTTMDSYSEEPYGIALYDFDGETDEDLSFKTNEKIYLLKRLNEEWYMGRDKRGLEGMFPVNYVEVKVPLSDFPAENHQQEKDEPVAVTKVRALYNFNAETAEDVTIMENDLVAVLYQITPEWLYGEIDGRRGQFPANYIEYVPPNLPQMPTATS